MFRPHYARIFGMVRKRGADVHFHSDGCTVEIVPELIEIGANVLNLQLSALDLDKLGSIV